MAAERSGRRDMEEMLALLWRTGQPGSRGPRGTLSVDRIVTAAVDIADADGIAGVSMRRVAERLGVTTMALYRHVPGKDDLLDLMFEAAGGLPDTEKWPEPWRPRLEAFARSFRDRLRARPWMLDIPISGPPMGPNNLAWMEAALAAMAGTGLSEDDKMGVLTLLSGYAHNEARQELSIARAAPRTGLGYEEWGPAYGTLLARIVSDGRYPALSRLVRAGVFDSAAADPDDDFEHGLAFLLDGVEALIHNRRR
ncbi:TetR/AcrR family transcriptional regulator [Streptomyces sp. ACA25]|uniref:TetR/AcrR family transcriptional regulator n=1 Tax=Streptomyces sp. ACA25 TaxID=3022596 RepID=UPI002306FA54|nr:TetR/AcrR family transcriptional regulator [Streptomyces sp. ACA25]MDB1087180.1 TetR/AcrR family transcriptional regulator [Streptomyces sp. ACA25]